MNQKLGKYSPGTILELPQLKSERPVRIDYMTMFTLNFGRLAKYVKILKKLHNECHYYVAVFDKEMKEMVGSHHNVPYSFIDDNFILNVGLSLEHREKERR